MKKSILNLGKTLNKAEQKTINGGNGPLPTSSKCYPAQCNQGGSIPSRCLTYC